MSYILDALRKSEQQRTRGAAPSLLVVPVADAPPRRPMTLWYGLLATALLAAGIAIGTLRPWQTEAPAQPTVAARPQAGASPAATQSPPAPIPTSPAPTLEAAARDDARTVVAVAPTTPVALTPAPTAPPKPAPALASGDAARVEATAAKSAPSDAGKPRVAVVTNDAAGKAQVAPTPVPAVHSESPTATPPKAAPAVPAATEGPAPAAAKPAEPAAARPPMTFAELPLAVQQDVPRITVQFHLYSGNPKDRLAGINDRMLREGDAIQPGLVLEQITPDGMILSFKGYRFLRGAR